MIGRKSQVSFTFNFDTCYLHMTSKIFYIRSAFHLFHKHILSFHVLKICFKFVVNVCSTRFGFLFPKA